MKKYLKIAIVIVAFVVGFFLGFIVGRTSQPAKVRFVKQKTISGSVIPLPPYIEIKPSNVDLPYKYVFITDTFLQVVDTAKIIEEYSAIREYDFTLFDDVFGKLDLKPTLQYNKFRSIDYSFTPITEVRVKKDIFNIFTTIGYSTNETVLLGGGIYYKRFGLEYNYNYRLRKYDYSNNIYHTFKLNYKF